MGGFFSFKVVSSQKDPDASFDGSAAAVTATAPDDTSAACLAEAAVPARKEGVTALASVADAARNSGGEAVRTAEGTHRR